MDSAFSSKLKQFGYVLWTSYLTHTECDLIRDQISSHSATSHSFDSINGQCQSIANLLEADPAFYRLATENRLNRFLRTFFSEHSYQDEFPYQLSRIQYRNIIEPCLAQTLHLDSRLPGVQPCISLHCFLYLDDASLEDGATQGSSKKSFSSKVSNRVGQEKLYFYRSF